MMFTVARRKRLIVKKNRRKKRKRIQTNRQKTQKKKRSSYIKWLLGIMIISAVCAGYYYCFIRQEESDNNIEDFDDSMSQITLVVKGTTHVSTEDEDQQKKEDKSQDQSPQEDNPINESQNSSDNEKEDNFFNIQSNNESIGLNQQNNKIEQNISAKENLTINQSLSQEMIQGTDLMKDNISKISVTEDLQDHSLSNKEITQVDEQYSQKQDDQENNLQQEDSDQEEEKQKTDQNLLDCTKWVVKINLNANNNILNNQVLNNQGGQKRYTIEQANDDQNKEQNKFQIELEAGAAYIAQQILSNNNQDKSKIETIFDLFVNKKVEEESFSNTSFSKEKKQNIKELLQIVPDFIRKEQELDVQYNVDDRINDIVIGETQKFIEKFCMPLFTKLKKYEANLQVVWRMIFVARLLTGYSNFVNLQEEDESEIREIPLITQEEFNQRGNKDSNTLVSLFLCKLQASIVEE